MYRESWSCSVSRETNAVDTIVTVASWEPRFVLGVKRILDTYRAPRLLTYYIQEYCNQTAKAREHLARLLGDYPDVRHDEKDVSFDEPGKTWQTLESDLGPGSGVGRRVLVDVTTMPRDVIWGTLFWLEASSTQVRYIYNRPKAYTGDWLARDPNRPRFVFKLAGTLEIGRPTALVAVTGFDESRCRQAAEFYEPARIVVATQRGEQYDNNVRNVGPKFSESSFVVENVQVDAFSGDHGYSTLRVYVEKLIRKHNVILCSFGPKPSAIALYRLHREFPQTALSYIGCKEYNLKYSDGLGDAVEGAVEWRENSPK